MILKYSHEDLHQPSHILYLLQIQFCIQFLKLECGIFNTFIFTFPALKHTWVSTHTEQYTNTRNCQLNKYLHYKNGYILYKVLCEWTGYTIYMEHEYILVSVYVFTQIKQNIIKLHTYNQSCST